MSVGRVTIADVRILVGRAAHLALGGALALPYVGLTWLLVRAAGTQQGFLVLGVLALLTVVGGVGVAFLPPVRPLGAVVARSLLTAEIPVPDEAGGGRARAAGWFAVTVVAGAVAVLAVLVLVPQAVGFAVLPLTGGALQLGPGTSWPVTGPALLLGPVAAVVALALAVGVVAGLGAALARLAPWLLGPTPEEALAAERTRAGRLAWRARLAGELHDHLGHTLTAVTLQAGAARRVLDADPAAARRALEAIEERGRSAVDELDRVLTLLRDPEGADPGGLSPPADVPALVEGIRTTGREVHLDLVGEPGLLARRVVQEGLTNAVRHGAPGPIDVAVAVGTGTTTVALTNPLGPDRPGSPPGRGLAGLRERVEAAGGTLQAGAADGTWTLRAELPGDGS